MAKTDIASITTAGYNSHGVCLEQRDYVCEIPDGIFQDETFFAAVYTLDQNDDPFGEAVWLKANPNLNVSIDVEKLRSYAKQAANSPAGAGEFKTKRLNLWQNAHSAWLSMEQWKACADPTLRIEDFEGQPAWIGVDLADTNDLAAVVTVFEKNGMFHAFSRFFLPEMLVDICANRTTTHYRIWADEDYIVTTPGDFIDHKEIEKYVRELCATHQVEKVRLEHYGSAMLSANLLVEGLPVEICHKKPDSYSEPAKYLEAKVEIAKFRHDGNPVLSWMASNTVVNRRVNGTILPKKENKDSAKKIDGIGALIMAIGAAIARNSSRSHYDANDLIFI